MSDRQVFLKAACIPESPVSMAVVSDVKKYITDELERLGIRTIYSDKLSGISGAERFHADMGFCYAGEGHIYAACNSSPAVRARLREEGLIIHETKLPITAAVPSLNVRILNNKLLCCTRTADSELLRNYADRNYSILHTNQRYTACSCAVINGNALITSDESVYRLCPKNDIDVLKISPSHIELEGYSYGFIGGCCGLIAKDMLAFSGDISAHPDYENIKSFSANHNVSLLSLSDKPLYDIGGILPIKEKLR